MFHVLEILGNNKKLSVSRGLIELSSKDTEPSLIPLDSIGIVLTAGFGISYTHNFLLALGEYCIPLVLCNKQYFPFSLVLPFEAHGTQSKIQKAQVRASVPKQKRLWQQCIQGKIQGNCYVLDRYGIDSSPLFPYIRKVHSGDSGNAEGNAASIYWKLLFSSSFRRRQDSEDSINSMLNYSYTVLRALIARALLTSGLHYAFGIYHSNARNSMPLVDDIMEPYRCLCDSLVMEAHLAGHNGLNAASKKILTSIPILEIEHPKGKSIAYECIRKTTISLAKVYLGEDEELCIYNKRV
ncbi:MAG: type II CRISPR-associated endonuclease Cas1 [Desulfovibrionaceae bacterium]